MVKNAYEKDLFEKMLQFYDTLYDTNEKMQTQFIHEHNNSAALRNQMVHPTQESFMYALQLMESGSLFDFNRAVDILYKVIPLQDTVSSSRTYGVWPWCCEEPLIKISSPDYTLAELCSKELLQILVYHDKRLPNNLHKIISESVLHACSAISSQNIQPEYTSFSITRIYVLLTAGEYFHKPNLFNCAKNELSKVFEFNIKYGVMQEYNCPPCNMAAARDLGYMLKDIKDADCLHMAQKLNDMVWKCIAEHFHYRTRQWAGPHRSNGAVLQDTGYFTVQGTDAEKAGRGFLKQMERAFDYKVQLLPPAMPELEQCIPMDFFTQALKCPEKYMHYFTIPEQERQISKRYCCKAAEYQNGIAVTYLADKYTLGTFYKSDFRNQNKAFLCYFGTAQQPHYLRVRCLRDFNDYASGVFITAQKQGCATGIVNFATDGEDIHHPSDLTSSATVQAHDFRLRFEIGGYIDDVVLNPQDDGKTVIGKTKEIHFKITFPYAKFGNNQILFKIGNDGNIKYIDVIFYSGEETYIRFAKLEQSICAFTFEINDMITMPFNSDIALNVEPTRIVLSLNHIVAVACQAQPASFQALYESGKAYIESKEYQMIF